MSRLAQRLDEGSALLKQGRPGQAKAVFDQIADENPGNLALLSDIAKRYQNAGRLGFAAQTWKQISEIKPDARVFDVLGDLYERLGKPYRAMCSFRSAVLENGSNTNYINKFYESLRNVPARLVEQDAPEIKVALERCLQNEDARHKRGMHTWVALLVNDPGFIQLAECFREPGRPRTAEEETLVREWLTSDYLTLGLRRIPVVGNAVFESHMTAIRRFLALSPIDQIAPFAVFVNALAEHCFGNEYVFWVAEAEQARIDELLETLLSGALSGVGEMTLKVALLGCYLPLQTMANAKDIAEEGLRSEDLSYRQMLNTLINEPFECQKLARTVPSLANIEDNVSSAVREMYEVNPYPRWRGMSGISEPEHEKQSAGKDILVAGCGTGQEALSRAFRYPGASILGIDLSLASLSYAKFMANRYGIQNLELMQADILNADQIDREFDLIFSSGVLHHMDDPVAGWRQLLTRLKQGGVMQVSLYSELARQDIVRCRNWIEEKGFDSTASGIRRFRKQVQELDDDHPVKEITRRKDFYSLSHCRDLVFHVQEHRFTFPRLKETLETLGLRLIKMAPPSWIGQRYLEMYPSDPSGRNFENWDAFEHKYPEAFWGMYTLWVCREGDTPHLPQWLRG